MRFGARWVVATLCVVTWWPGLHAHAEPQERGLVHCTRKGERPRQIARRYGVSLRWLTKYSGNVQRLLAENRKRRAMNARALKREKRRYRAAMKAWKSKGRRGKRPAWSHSPKADLRFEAMVPIRVLRARKNAETRDAVMRLQLGASIKWVAETYGVDPDLVRCVNRLNARRLRIRCRRRRRKGHRAPWQSKFESTCDGGREFLWIRLPIPRRPGVPRGLPSRGRLVHGEPFPTIPGVHVKAPRLSFAASHVVTLLIDAVGTVQRTFDDSPDLVIGDISRRGGGAFAPHKSHQNGLDVDLGYYHRKKVPVEHFTKVTAKTLDKHRTWTLIKRLLESGEVQYIFMSKSVQKMLRPFMLNRRRADAAWCLRFVRALSDRKRYGRPRRVDAKYGPDAGWVRCVKRSFGHRGFSNALIRHAKGHDDHIHVRFFPRKGRWRAGGAP